VVDGLDKLPERVLVHVLRKLRTCVTTFFNKTVLPNRIRKRAVCRFLTSGGELIPFCSTKLSKTKFNSIIFELRNNLRPKKQTVPIVYVEVLRIFHARIGSGKRRALVCPIG